VTGCYSGTGWFGGICYPGYAGFYEVVFAFKVCEVYFRQLEVSPASLAAGTVIVQPIAATFITHVVRTSAFTFATTPLD